MTFRAALFMNILFLEIKPSTEAASSLADISPDEMFASLGGGNTIQFEIEKNEVFILVNGEYAPEFAQVPGHLRVSIVREALRLWRRLSARLPPGLYHCVPGGGTERQVKSKERFYRSQGFRSARPTLKDFRKSLDEEHRMLLDAELAEQGRVDLALMAISEKYSSWI